jgi:hypothetical protein
LQNRESSGFSRPHSEQTTTRGAYDEKSGGPRFAPPPSFYDRLLSRSPLAPGPGGR